jgi:hypothetical protein
LKEKNKIKGDDLDSEDITAYSGVIAGVESDDGSLESGGAIMEAFAETDPSMKRAARNAKAKKSKKPAKTLKKKAKGSSKSNI